MSRLVVGYHLVAQEEFDELPVGTVIRSADHQSYVKRDDGWYRTEDNRRQPAFMLAGYNHIESLPTEAQPQEGTTMNTIEQVNAQPDGAQFDVIRTGRPEGDVVRYVKRGDGLVGPGDVYLATRYFAGLINGGSVTLVDSTNAPTSDLALQTESAISSQLQARLDEFTGNARRDKANLERSLHEFISDQGWDHRCDLADLMEQHGMERPEAEQESIEVQVRITGYSEITLDASDVESHIQENRLCDSESIDVTVSWSVDRTFEVEAEAGNCACDYVGSLIEEWLDDNEVSYTSYDTDATECRYC